MNFLRKIIRYVRKHLKNFVLKTLFLSSILFILIAACALDTNFTPLGTSVLIIGSLISWTYFILFVYVNDVLDPDYYEQEAGEDDDL